MAELELLLEDRNSISGEEFYEKIKAISDKLSYMEENYEKFLDATIRTNIDILLDTFRDQVAKRALNGITRLTFMYSKKIWFNIKSKIFADSDKIFELRDFSDINAYSIGLNKFYQESINKLFPKPFSVIFTDEEAVEKVMLTISWKI